MNSVVVVHPGLQHAHQLAWALHEVGLLAAFWSGVPVRASGESVLFGLPTRLRAKVKVAEIPAALRRHPVAWQALLRSGALMQSPAVRHDFSHRVFHWFDRWTARRVALLRPRAVVAFENSAYQTFLAARAIGAKCILDAPSLHHAEAAKLIALPSNGYLTEINRRKDEEVKLADAIFTCSNLAKESYVRAGTPAEKIFPLLLGAELPPSFERGERSPGRARFMFAGTISERKSIDLILAAFRQLHNQGHDVELAIVGGSEHPSWIQVARDTPNVIYRPAVAQAELYGHFAAADCLLLPSRFDAFGMVVAEAMATGTPAIVSTMTGASEIIDQFPGSGWVIEPTAEAIFRCVLDKIKNPYKLVTASGHALIAAQHFSWPAYRLRVGRLVANILE
ncbi:glycosyltransferase family 4 protein [Paraburkholderia sp. GAS348]|uniref:glycosyltransferase family 4 protein n=1 Tax=Paraburkholderia sp. GAS348 TaxID=3035132 RepID=UPI003D208466